MKLSNLVVLILLGAALLGGCSGSVNTPEPLPTATLPPPTLQHTTTPNIVWLPLTATPTKIPTFGPVATQPNEQIYVDPEGWYSVRIPAEWQETIMVEMQ